MKIEPFEIPDKSELRKKILQIFWKYADINLFGCWEWTGRKRSKYASIILPGGKSTFAHRVSYALFIGPIARDMVIDHRCRNRGCVNPFHLRQCTHQDNCYAIQRRKLRERQYTIFGLL